MIIQNLETVLANSAYPDQTAPLVFCLHFLKHYCIVNFSFLELQSVQKLGKITDYFLTSQALLHGKPAQKTFCMYDKSITLTKL